MPAYTLPHLPWLRAFEAAARQQSFSGAAQELHVSPAAVSQQIRLLEQHLGFVLFRRLPRGVLLTDMGSAYLPSVRKAFDTLSMSTAGLFGSPGRRTLTLRCTAAFAVLWLSPRLQGFIDAHPGIDVRLFTAIWAELRKLGRHRRVAARQLLDRQVFGLVVGQAQVVGRLVQRFLGLLQVLDRLVNALRWPLQTRRRQVASCARTRP
jgi:hypothetical protein